MENLGTDRRDPADMMDGSWGSNRDWGGDRCKPLGPTAGGGGDKGTIWGGAEEDFRDWRSGRRDLGRTGEGRIGDDDSAPDWKTLLSSQPLSSCLIVELIFSR